MTQQVLLLFSLFLALVGYTLLGHGKFLWLQHHVSSEESRAFVRLMENPQQLKVLLEKKIQLYPRDAMAWRLLAGCYHQLGDEVSAQYAANKAQQLASAL
jgi:cytochrome c-type biogenesis protein CcmH/NrfG